MEWSSGYSIDLKFSFGLSILKGNTISWEHFKFISELIFLNSRSENYSVKQFLLVMYIVECFSAAFLPYWNFLPTQLVLALALARKQDVNVNAQVSCVRK